MVHLKTRYLAHPKFPKIIEMTPDSIGNEVPSSFQRKLNHLEMRNPTCSKYFQKKETFKNLEMMYAAHSKETNSFRDEIPSLL